MNISKFGQHVALGTLTAGLFFSCAKGNSNSTSGAGGSVADTTSVGGAGGAGGNTDLGPCGTDCSQIETPECQEAVCNETTKKCEVHVKKDGDSCEDGLFCTAKDTCEGGTCKAGGPNTCATNPPPCKKMACDEESKSCYETDLPNGDLCVPEDKCDINGQCSFGVCIGVHNDCDSYFPPDDCHVGVCNPMNGLCEPVAGNDGAACNDAMDKCTVEKTCKAGQCIGGVPMDCSALSKGCFNGECDAMTGKCKAVPLKQGDPCAEATDACNAGTCDVNGKCVAMAVNENNACDDGLACTSNTVCMAGACAGGTSSVSVYFHEDFGSNAAGWTFGNEWEIGSAKASVDEDYGNPDPSVDHTAANQNNGVAGVVLGGNASTTPHDFSYLTSPVVNTASASTLYFEFYRWLNSDYSPYMVNTVEVFDGTAWVSLWTSGGSPGVKDNVWTKVSYDVTNYKNAQMRVRFGFKVGNAAFTVSQWNVDDVLIASAACQ